jgi:hypothetical protein
VRLAKLVGSLAFGAALVAASATASAQQRGNPLPLNYIDRPLTLPGGVLEPQIEVDAVHNPAANTAASFYSYNMNVGAAVGLTRNFELQSTFLPMQLGPNTQYGDPNVQATLLLARGKFDLGARFNVTMHTVPLTTFSNVNGQYVKSDGIKVESTTLSPGFPLVLRFHHRARVDTGLFADITLGQSVQTTDTAGGTAKTDGAIWGLRLPVDLSVALAKNAYIGAGSGFKIDDLNQSSSSFSMPFKLFAGWSWGTRKHPYLDLEPYVSWDHLITPGQTTTAANTATAPSAGRTVAADQVQPTTATTSGPQSTFHWDAWQMGLQVRGYLHFM